MSEWRTIDTAPRKPVDKNGYGPTIFLLVDGEPSTGFWDEDFSNFFIENAIHHRTQPSHWMAVPALPAG